jgi:hypothetical protein
MTMTFSRELGGGAAGTTTSAVTAEQSHLGPGRRRDCVRGAKRR